MAGSSEPAFSFLAQTFWHKKELLLHKWLLIYFATAPFFLYTHMRHQGWTAILFIRHVTYDIMAIYNKRGKWHGSHETILQIWYCSLPEPVKLWISSKLYSGRSLREKIGVTAETLGQLSTDSKFSILYTTALEIFDLYPSITSDAPWWVPSAFLFLWPDHQQP